MNKQELNSLEAFTQKIVKFKPKEPFRKPEKDPTPEERNKLWKLREN